jgi:hypothetical protein
MKLIKDYEVNSAYDFLVGEDGEEEACEKAVEDLIGDYGSDYDLIEAKLNEKYPSDKYFVLVDFINGGNGYFHIRIWEKK